MAGSIKQLEVGTNQLALSSWQQAVGSGHFRNAFEMFRWIIASAVSNEQEAKGGHFCNSGNFSTYKQPKSNLMIEYNINI